MATPVTIDPDVQAIAEQFSNAPAFVHFVQAIVDAEGPGDAIVRAVQCSDGSVTTRQKAIEVVCRSAVHRAFDYLLNTHPNEFVLYMGSYWAPVGVANDPTHLNANWSTNVAKLWTV